MKNWFRLISILLILFFFQTIAFAEETVTESPMTQDLYWDHVKNFLDDPDEKTATIFAALVGYLSQEEKGPHFDEALLWTIKYQEDYKGDEAVILIPALNDLLFTATNQEVLAEAQFWRGHILYGLGRFDEAFTGWNLYLNLYPEGPRTDEIIMLLKLEKNIESARKELLAGIESTLNYIAENDDFNVGLNFRTDPAFANIRLDLAQQDGMSLSLKSSWLNFSVFTGSEGLFVYLPDDDKKLTYRGVFHVTPKVDWNEKDLNLGFDFTGSEPEEKKTVNLDVKAVMEMLTGRIARSHMIKGCGRRYGFYTVQKRPTEKPEPKMTFRFNRKGLLKGLEFRTRENTRILLDHITFSPKVNKKAMKVQAGEKQFMDINQLSLASAGQYVFTILEKHKSTAAYARIMEAKPQILSLLGQFDNILEVSRNTISTEEELKLVQTDLSTNPDDLTLLEKQTKFLIKLNRLEQAKSSLEKFKANKGDIALGMVLDAEILSAEQKPEEARAILDKALDDYPDNALVLIRFARAITSQSPVDGITYAEKSLVNDSKLTETYHFLGTVYTNIGFADKGIAVLDEGIEKSDDPDDLRVIKAYILMQGGQADKALETVQPILESSPTRNTPMAKMIEFMVKMVEYEKQNQE